MSADPEDTPTKLLPAMPRSNDPVLIGLQAVLQELKILGRRVESVSSTINGHVTDIAVFKVQLLSSDAIVKGLAARIEALESERDELTKSVLAKAVTLVLALTTVIGIAIAYFTKKAG